MAGTEDVDELLAPDSDEESIDINDEEYTSLLDINNEVGEGPETTIKTGVSKSTAFVLEEELDYEPADDHDLIVDVTAEDMFESDEEICVNMSACKTSNVKMLTIISENENGPKKPSYCQPEPHCSAVMKPAGPDKTVTSQGKNNIIVTRTPSHPTRPHPSLPSTLTRVRERLSSPAPAIICWHRSHNMRKVERGLDMTTSIHAWHLFHAWSMENSRRSLTDRFRELKNEELEHDDDDGGNGCLGGGGGRLSERFGVLAQRAEGRVVGKRKRGEELGQMKNKILRKLGRKEVDENEKVVVEKWKDKFGEEYQNFFVNMK
eukprot:GFUD01020708.1.p1 GENE.GFUD01020708.1~~GFUD01020708.1.p1  ORF type:complete len:319 (+),score=138.09 GFUD01020708.1:42-998(+)